jgi:hypothetical protein
MRKFAVLASAAGFLGAALLRAAQAVSDTDRIGKVELAQAGPYEMVQDQVPEDCKGIQDLALFNECLRSARRQWGED